MFKSYNKMFKKGSLGIFSNIKTCIECNNNNKTVIGKNTGSAKFR